MTLDNVPWWKRRGTVAGIVILVIVAVVGGGFALVRKHSDRDRLAMGASRSGDYRMSNPELTKQLHLAVPSARIMVNVQVGRGGSKYDNSTKEFTRIKAPRSGRLVHLEWSSTVVSGGATEYDGGHPTSLSIRSKDRSVSVDPAIVPKAGPAGDPENSRHKVVAVPDDLSDLELVANFRGRTQTVSLVSGRREAGDFASLYSPPSVTTEAATIEKNTSSPSLRSSSEALPGTMTRTPYLDALGWAPAGHEWILIGDAGYRLDTDAARWSDSDHSTRYVATEKPTFSIAVNGKKPVRTIGRPSVDASHDGKTVTRDYVFSVKTGAAVITDAVAPLSLKRSADSDAHGPAHPTLRLHTSRHYPGV